MARGISDVADASALQTVFEWKLFFQWAEENNMLFDNIKFDNLRFGPYSTLKLTSTYTGLSGIITDMKEHIRDLEVMMSDEGSYRN